MAEHHAMSSASVKAQSDAVPRAGWLTRTLHSREGTAVVILFLVASGLRLWLAAHGWPYINSDEAVLGLMSEDIWHGVAHPIFSYGQDYIGALQAYLAAPIFAVLHGDPVALRLATLLQTLLFMAVIYALARRLYIAGVALLTLALLTFGSEYLMKHELQAGAGAQDTLLFGALVVWLATLRLRGGWGWRARLALDAGIGLAIGLGLWGDFLFLPYVAMAGVALSCTALRALARGWMVNQAGQATLRLALDLGVSLCMALVGATPLILANISSHGETLRNVVNIAGTPGAKHAPISLSAHLIQYAKQISATLLVGLPNALGSQLVCNGCAIWPAAGGTHNVQRALHAVAISLPITLFAFALWLVAAWPLARDIGRALRRLAAAPLRRWASILTVGDMPDARWWGKFMLVTGCALTVAQYAVSQASYTFPTFTNRYLIGIYVATPLIAAPLVAAAQSAWRALRSQRLPDMRALGGTALLALVLVFSLAGAVNNLRIAIDGASFGDPLDSRDVGLATFLKAHNATRFYTGYWTCGRLILATNEHLACAVVATNNAFEPGFNRYAPAQNAVDATQQPAWVFDMRSPDLSADVPQQIAACVRTGQRTECAGYVSALVDGYLVYYYPH
jgi:hypothetical protein